MMAQKLYLATAAAAFLYVISPGPAFLALFMLAASKGRAAGAWFIGGHLVADLLQRERGAEALALLESASVLPEEPTT